MFAPVLCRFEQEMTARSLYQEEAVFEIKYLTVHKAQKGVLAH